MLTINKKLLTSFTLILLGVFTLFNLYCSKEKSSAIFAFDGSNGATPKGTLTLHDSSLFGYTSAGGKHGKGVIFKLDKSGTNFKIVHDFKDGSDNGAGNEPHHDALLYFNKAFYGAALYGGNKNNGVIFRINSDGSDYKPLHVFTGGDNDGAQPHSGVVLLDSVFYGLTAEGGEGNKGTIYSMNPDGSNFSVLYSFFKATGHNPHGRVTPGSNGNILYGITKTGGTENLGVIFTYNLEDSTYRDIHNFRKGKKNGNTTQHGYLTRIENSLYGLTYAGGEKDKGVIYSLNEDGSEFKILHSFKSRDDNIKDGESPYGSLCYSNGFLYGCTRKGGENDEGIVFRITPSGKYYEIMYSFNENTSGAYPIDNVILNQDGSEIYVYGQVGGEYDPSGKNQFGAINKIKVE